MKYLVNTPDVVAEVIDGELVAIQLGSGCYYHSNKSGSIIWTLIESGKDTSEIALDFSKIFSLDEGKSQKIADEFIKKLKKEKLIRKLARGEEIKARKNTRKLKKMKFETPKLKKHTDMKELLLLDPIHDIGDDTLPLQTVE